MTKGSSAALGLLSSFYALAHHTDQFSVEAGIDAERDAAANTSEDEKAEAPDPGDSSWYFFREVVRLASAHGAQ